MSGEIAIHERENNDVSEEFLKANGKKFGNDCVQVLRLLYKGLKLTAKQVNDMTGMADGGRRLRDVFANRSDCKRQKRYTNGKLEGMEYWLDIPGYPTKAELQEWFSEHQKEQPIAYKKGTATAADFALKIIKGGKQTELF